jgi:hypothetical protein
VSLHLDIPTQPEITRLLNTRASACISIYLPTSPLPQDADAARIGFKTLTGEAAEQLGGTRNEHLDDLLRDDSFWSDLAVGLAAFATPDGVRTFRLPNRIATIAEVSDRFHLKPLLRSVSFPHAGFVLALAQGSARLIEVAPDVPAAEVAVPDLPDRVVPAGTEGRVQNDEGQKVRMRQYARAVDRALRPVLAGSGLPLILACAEPLASIFRSVCSYPELSERGLAGNPETATPAELAADARGILDALYEDELAALRERFEVRRGEGRAATDLTDIARAATIGAVDTLLADMDAVVDGFVDEDTGAVTLDDSGDASNYGVIDELARRVLLAGGRVLALRQADIPDGAPAAAILRYAP